MTEAKLHQYLTNGTKRHTQRGKAALFLRSCGTATTKAIAEQLGISINTAAARIGELQDSGCVTQLGMKEGYTVWRWEADAEKWGNNARRRHMQKRRKDLIRLMRDQELSGSFRNIAAREADRISVYLEESQNGEV